jgi:hypothetical protein
MTVVARRAAQEQLAAGAPLVDRLELAVLPGRVGVAGGRGTECEALGM